jgi:hypothetical protein
MRKNIVSVFLISAFSVSLAAATTALGDASQAGTYDESTTGTSQQPGISDDQSSLNESQQPGMSGVTEDTSKSYSEPSAQQPGTTDDTAMVSTAQRSDLDLSPMQKEKAAFQPQVGMINFLDTSGNVDNRMTYGFTADMNFPSILGNNDLYLGPQTGFFYSHLGSQNANFVGSSPDTGADANAGANMFYVPTDIKLGVNLGNFRPSIHGGANLIYRSIASSLAAGSDPASGSDSAWSYLPNLGLDLEYAVADSFAFVARPDITFGGSNRIWTASIGASIPLG